MDTHSGVLRTTSDAAGKMKNLQVHGLVCAVTRSGTDSVSKCVGVVNVLRYEGSYRSHRRSTSLWRLLVCIVCHGFSTHAMSALQATETTRERHCIQLHKISVDSAVSA